MFRIDATAAKTFARLALTAAVATLLAASSLQGTERTYRVSFDTQFDSSVGPVTNQPFVSVHNPNDNPADLSTTITLSWNDRDDLTNPSSGLTLHANATDCTGLSSTLEPGEGATVSVLEALGNCTDLPDCGSPPCGDDCTQLTFCDPVTGICESRCFPDPQDVDVPDVSRITVKVETDDSGTQGALKPVVGASEVRVDQDVTDPEHRIVGWSGTHLEEQ